MQLNQSKQMALNSSVNDSKDFLMVNNNNNNNNNINLNFQSNYSNDDVYRQMMLQRQSQLNQIKFMKRQQNNAGELYASDAFGATINFQNTFIKQKAQLAMSPSVTNTDFSVSKKSSKYFQDDDDDNSFVMHQSPNIQVQQLLTVPMTKVTSPANIIENTDPRPYEHQKKINFDKKVVQDFFSQGGDTNQYKQPQGVELSYPQLDDSFVKIDILSYKEEYSAPKQPENLTPQTFEKYPLGSGSYKSKEQESPNIVDLTQNKLSFKTFVNTINTKNQPLQTNKKQSTTTSHRSPATSTSYQQQVYKSQAISRIGAASVRAKASQVSTFDNTMKVNKETKSSKTNTSNAYSTLQRKRSTPLLNNDKNGITTLNKQQFSQQQINSDQQNKGEISAKASHFKQRAFYAQKTQKQPQVLTIDLERRQRLEMPRKWSDNQSLSRKDQFLNENNNIKLHKAYNTNEYQAAQEVQGTQGENKVASLTNSTKEIERKSYTILNKKQSRVQSIDQGRNDEVGVHSNRRSKPNLLSNIDIIGKSNVSARSSQISSKNSKISHNNSSIISKPSKHSIQNILSNQDKMSVSNYQTVRPSDPANQLDFFASSTIFKGSLLFPHQQAKPFNEDFTIISESDTQQLHNIHLEEKGLKANTQNLKGSQTQNTSFINGQARLNSKGQVLYKEYFLPTNNVNSAQRTHSFEPCYQDMDMIESHRQEQLPHKPINTLQSNQQRSPLASSYISSTNYLKALQNSELITNSKTQKINQSNYSQDIKRSPTQGSQSSLMKKQPGVNAHQLSHQHSAQLSHQDSLAQAQKVKSNNHGSNSLYAQQSYYSVRDLSQSTKNLLPSSQKPSEASDSNIQIVDNAISKRDKTKLGDNKKAKLKALEQALLSKSNSSNSQKVSPRPIFEKSGVISVTQNFEYPINKKRSQRNASRSTNQANLLNSGSENDLVLIDLPRQIPAGGFPKQQRSDNNLELKQSRKSELLTEIDKMMEAKPVNRNKTGTFTNMNKKSDAEKRPPGTTKVRNCGSINAQNFEQQPFFEIKYELNEPALQLGHSQQQSLSKASDGNTLSLNSSNMMHSDYQRLQKAGPQTTQAKKRGLRHGLTTCLVFPNKESNDYLKRDLNQDVFCKISSHMGDVDNDPHTPKSNQSPKSIEKNLRKIRFQRGLDQQLSQSYNEETFRQIQVDPYQIEHPTQIPQNKLLSQFQQHQQPQMNAQTSLEFGQEVDIIEDALN